MTDRSEVAKAVAMVQAGSRFRVIAREAGRKVGGEELGNHVARGFEVNYEKAIGQLIRTRASTTGEIVSKALVLGTALRAERFLERLVATAPDCPGLRRDIAIAASLLLDLIDLAEG